ncbi:hypothetical protein [Bacteriophage sp.]|nr:hypothetical protein [Bacteriophage sp.]
MTFEEFEKVKDLLNEYAPGSVESVTINNAAPGSGLSGSLLRIVTIHNNERIGAMQTFQPEEIEELPKSILLSVAYGLVRQLESTIALRQQHQS